MSVSSVRGGKAAVLRYLTSEIARLANNGELELADAERWIDELEARLGTTEPLVPLPHVVPGGFVRSEDIDALVHAANASYTYLMGEADTIAAAARMVAYLVNGRMDDAERAIEQAGGYVGNIQLYLKAKRGGADGIVVDLAALNGVTYTCGQVTSQLKSARRLNATTTNIRTNGRAGNLLELSGNYETDKAIPTWQVNFVDPQNARKKNRNLDDNNDVTIYEVEATEIAAAAKAKDYIPLPIREPVAGGYSDIVYDKAPDNGELWLEIKLQVAGSASMVQVIPALLAGQTLVVDSLMASADGTRYVEVARNFVITPETNLYLDQGAVAGTGLFFLPPGTINFLLLRFKTRSSYNTLLAHVKELDSAGKYVEPRVYDISQSKSNYFSTQTVQAGSETRHREVYALPAARWSIPIRSILVTKNEYESTSHFQTETYKLANPCERVAISVDEVVPTGCAINYEISHDGKTWTAISPIERTGGTEIVVFGADTSNNPNVPQTAFVAVDKPVRELTLRATLVSTGDGTPVIRSITIEPMAGS